MGGSVSTSTRLPILESYLTGRQRVKLVVAIVLVAISLAIFLLESSLNNFAPRQASNIYLVSDGGGFQWTKFTENNPLFFIFGAIITQVLGLSPLRILWTPVLVIPIVTSIWAVATRISGDRVLGGLVAAHFIIVGTDATYKIYYLGHGLGYVLLFLLVLITIRAVSTDGFTNRHLSLLLIMAIPLSSISYNNYAKAILFFIALAGLYLIVENTGVVIQSNDYGTRFIHLALILVIVELGVVGFTFTDFIPALATGVLSDITALDRVLLTWTSSQRSSELAYLFYQSPPHLQYIKYAKYGVLGLTIGAAGLVILTKAATGAINGRTIAISALMIAMGGYVLLRIPIGLIPFSDIGLLGIFCALWLAGARLKWRDIDLPTHRISSVIIVFVLVTTLASASVLYTQDGYVENTDDVLKTEAPAKWHAEYGAEEPIHSDVFSRHLIILFWVSENDGARYQEALHQSRILPPDAALSATGRSDAELASGFYLFNYDLTQMSIAQWRVFDSWQPYRGEIERHPTQKVYSTGDIVIYRSP